MTAIAFRVTGRVQGVSFRAFTQAEARARGIGGWVENTPDGAVRGLAEGPPDAIAALLDRLRRGPPGAAVTQVASEPATATGAQGFAIRR
jgi:acylphosphatase